MAERKNVLKVMISSTIVDLPKHREQVKDACLRQGMFPVMMEHLLAGDAEAITTALKMVDEADVYVGVFAYRYGYIPKENNPKQISVTEMEYDRAVERGIPRFIFLMHEDHSLKVSDIEKGIGGEKLDALRRRLGAERVVNFFKNPDDLRAHVINTLASYAKKQKAKEIGSASEQPKPAAKFHYVSDIPQPPEVYVTHPYTLLQTHSLVGRQPELNLLTKWVTQTDSEVYKAHILSVVAIGGMGKSALTWKWFEDIAPKEMRTLAGRMWWSFYESDATFENFIIRALAYVSKRPIEEIQKINPQDKESQLLAILDKEPFLLVLDGLERILIAYARMDAAYLTDSDYDQATANYVAKAYGLPPGAAQSFTGEHRLRKAADPRVGMFLKKLAKLQASRILISTRLYPFDLQRMDGLPLPGCTAVFLPGLSNDDALNLWRNFGVSGAHDQLLPIFNSFGNHALLIQALVSEIANYRSAPGDFEKWRMANPHFAPARYPRLQDAMAHVLEYSLSGLGEVEQKVLQTIAGFRMPTGYDTLSAVLTGDGKPCESASELDAALAELEDRGLVGWDRRANRYDLHPVVRSRVWNSINPTAKEELYERVHRNFPAVSLKNWDEVKNLKDLLPYAELYSCLVGLGRKGEAEKLLSTQIHRLINIDEEVR
ncbi:MAG TPA: DUF4062 domain-containing protein [Pyrinomonadaceae bacterium]|jgi:hypothetical protein|nr:DUF4062 domain-containing protein [Pyrinomonadaceae bacterium]